MIMPSQASRLNSIISPGWQSSASQMAFKVLKRIALIFPVLIFEIGRASCRERV